MIVLLLMWWWWWHRCGRHKTSTTSQAPQAQAPTGPTSLMPGQHGIDVLSMVPAVVQIKCYVGLAPSTVREWLGSLPQPVG